MNQAAYAEAAEIGRVDLFIRSGAWDRWRGDGYNPMAAQQEITYRREIKPLARYAMDTRFIGQEDRFALVRTVFFIGDKVHTVCNLKVMFVGPSGVCSADEVTMLLGDLVVDPLPVENWRVLAS